MKRYWPKAKIRVHEEKRNIIFTQILSQKRELASCKKEKGESDMQAKASSFFNKEERR